MTNANAIDSKKPNDGFLGLIFYFTLNFHKWIKRSIFFTHSSLRIDNSTGSVNAFLATVSFHELSRSTHFYIKSGSSNYDFLSFDLNECEEFRQDPFLSSLTFGRSSRMRFSKEEQYSFMTQSLTFNPCVLFIFLLISPWARVGSGGLPSIP